MMNHRFSDTAYGLSRHGGDWRERAACRDAPPELFHPIAGHGAFHAAIFTSRTEAAKRFCSICPVRETCLDWAMGVGDSWGILGWTTPAERRALSAMRQELAEEAKPQAARCVNDHLVTEENTRFDLNGSRRCRDCVRESDARRFGKVGVR